MIMSWDGITAGDYGQVGKLTFTDTDTATAEDISSYTTTIQMILSDPDGNQSTVTATFDSDGTDGIIKYTLVSGDIDEAGAWKVRGKVTSASAVLTTDWHHFTVIA